MNRQNLKYFCFSCHQKLSNDGECVSPDCEEGQIKFNPVGLPEFDPSVGEIPNTLTPDGTHLIQYKGYKYIVHTGGEYLLVSRAYRYKDTSTETWVSTYLAYWSPEAFKNCVALFDEEDKPRIQGLELIEPEGNEDV